MKRIDIKRWSYALTLLTGVSMMAVSTGCQTVVGGQTLPSAYYLLDDVQYFPHGPEFVLSKTVEAHEDYRQRQQAIQQGIDPNAVGP